MQETQVRINLQNSGSNLFITDFPLLVRDILEMVASRTDSIPVKASGILTRENGYYRLCDEDGTKLSVEDGAGVLSGIAPGTAVVVEGILRCVVHKNGGVYPRLDARKVYFPDGKDVERFEEGSVLSEISEVLSRVELHGFHPYLEKLLTERFIRFESSGKFERVKILIIHGRDAQTHKDFEKGLKTGSGEFFEVFDLNFQEVNLTADERLASVIRRGSEIYDLIFIVRGGGDKKELEKVGGRETCLAIAESRVPVYCAIGHSFDRGISLIERVSQYAFATPSLAGVELGKAAKLVLENLNAKKALKDTHPERVRFLEERINQLEGETDRLRKKSLIYLYVILFLILLILIMITG